MARNLPYGGISAQHPIRIAALSERRFGLGGIWQSIRHVALPPLNKSVHLPQAPIRVSDALLIHVFFVNGLLGALVPIH
jgi:hypothetical protein